MKAVWNRTNKSLLKNDASLKLVPQGIALPQYRSIIERSRHTPCAATVEKAYLSSPGGRHTECACYFLNGIALNQNSDTSGYTVIQELTGMNPFEVGELEPHEPQRRFPFGSRRLFWLLMVIIGGLTLGLIGLLVAGWMLNG